MYGSRFELVELFVVVFLFVRRVLLRRRWRSSRYFCDGMNIGLLGVSLVARHSLISDWSRNVLSLLVMY